MSAIQTLVSYFSFKAFLDLQTRMIKLCLLLLGCLQTDPDFSDFSFGSYLFFLAIIDGSRTFYAGNATLDYHLLSSVL